MAEKGRGFAAMDQAKQREIASRGGRAAHRRGTAHQFTVEEAAAAGRKGGQSVSKNREHMAEIGRKGGLAAHSRGAAADESPNSPQPTDPTHPHHNGATKLPTAVEAAQKPVEVPAKREPEIMQAEAARVYHDPAEDETQRDDADWDSEELLEEGRMGNENATEEHKGSQPNAAHFEAEGRSQRTGGHGYGSFEEETSPQMAHGGEATEEDLAVSSNNSREGG